MSMEKNKKYIYLGIGVVLLVVILYFSCGKTGSTPNPAVTTTDNNPIVTSTDTTSSSVNAAPKIAPPAPADAPLSATQKYLDAIRVYKNTGYYFQFVACHGAPGTFTLKKGKKFMLDNRDGKSHKIVVQG